MMMSTALLVGVLTTASPAGEEREKATAVPMLQRVAAGALVGAGTVLLSTVGVVSAGAVSGMMFLPDSVTPALLRDAPALVVILVPVALAGVVGAAGLMGAGVLVGGDFLGGHEPPPVLAAKNTGFSKRAASNHAESVVTR